MDQTVKDRPEPAETDQKEGGRAEKAAQAAEPAAGAEVLAALAAEYPEAAVAGYDALPQEVKELAAGGMGLLEAYRLYDLKRIKAMYRELEAKYKAETANRTAAQASTGSLSGGEGPIKSYYTSEEWDRLPHSTKETLIKNGKIFEFMKKWSGRS